MRCRGSLRDPGVGGHTGEGGCGGSRGWGGSLSPPGGSLSPPGGRCHPWGAPLAAVEVGSGCAGGGGGGGSRPLSSPPLTSSRPLRLEIGEADFVRLCDALKVSESVREKAWKTYESLTAADGAPVSTGCLEVGSPFWGLVAGPC